MNQNYITITQVNNYIRTIFDENPHLKKIYLKGEISNFKHHTSGHLYLTLKDNESRISAIMFRSAASTLKFTPEDGMNVLVCGRISVYPAGGNYQIYIDHMEVDGLGSLYVEFEKLKRKLLQEGLFSKEHKKAIPKYPMKIGIVTAPTGAAIKDILSTIKRRFPICETILFPALVQGGSAAQDIANKINIANNYDIDVLIIGRGGGSIEDLWAFNEEIVARAIYNSHVPVISAVGHEVDVTISDYVADMRAPTPTGAAEMAVPTIAEVKNTFNLIENRLNSSAKNMINKYNEELLKLKSSYILKNPMSLYEIKAQKLDTLVDNLNSNIESILEYKKVNLKHLLSSYILENPSALIEPKGEIIKNKKIILLKDINSIINKNENNLQYTLQTLKLLNPLNILDKGYSLIKKDNEIVKDSKNLKINDKLHVILHDGEINVEVKEIIS